MLNERTRLAACLDGLAAQGADVSAILVVDGGSEDGTQALVAVYMACDPRIRLIDASPVPAGWNGKAWGLQRGLEALPPDTEWVLTIDADVRAEAGLATALAAFAGACGLTALSVAARQELATAGLALLHPALLTTLVYRYGLPGRATRRANDVQANGQCMLIRRDALQAIGGFDGVRDSRCEDVTLARALARAGGLLGFYEAGDLVATEMYADAAECWHNWPRSLPLRDRHSGLAGWLGLAEVTLVQASPLPLAGAVALLGRRTPRWMIGLLIVTAAVRMGVLVGTARAYRRKRWTYWLSPLCDAPVAVRLWQSALQRRHTWRGRALVR